MQTIQKESLGNNLLTPYLNDLKNAVDFKVYKV